MQLYRCFFLNEGDHIKAAESIETDAVGEAIDQALVMLRERPQYRTVEIWAGGQRVYRGEEPAQPDRPENAELSRAEKQTIPFLRMAAVQARHIADDAPDVAELLRILADKLDAEADDLARLAQAAD